MQKYSSKIIGFAVASTLAGAVALSAVTTVFGADVPARTGENSGRPATQQENKDFRTATKIDIKTMQGKSLDKKKQENVKRVIENRVKAHQNIINELTRRLDRVSALSAKIKASGKDTTTADGFIADAKTKLASAVSQLAVISTSTTTAVSATNPGERISQLRDLFDTVNSALKAIKKDIGDALASLKTLTNGFKPHDDNRSGTSSNNQ